MLGLWKNIGLTNIEVSSSVAFQQGGPKTHSMDPRRVNLREVDSNEGRVGVRIEGRTELHVEK